MEINGLPLHALTVHGAVVFGPLAALLAIGFVVPGMRERLRWPLALAALLAGGFVFLAWLSGRDHLANNPALGQLPAVADHHGYALWALIATLALTVVALLATVVRPAGPLRAGADVLLVAAAVATAATVFLTGDAGARSVWGG